MPVICKQSNCSYGMPVWKEEPFLCGYSAHEVLQPFMELDHLRALPSIGSVMAESLILGQSPHLLSLIIAKTKHEVQ